MLTKPLAATGGTLLVSADGPYIVAADNAPNQPLVTPNPGSLTSEARHGTSRSGAAVVARSTGKDGYTRGGTRPLVTPKGPPIVG